MGMADPLIKELLCVIYHKKHHSPFVFDGHPEIEAVLCAKCNSGYIIMKVLE